MAHELIHVVQQEVSIVIPRANPTEKRGFDKGKHNIYANDQRGD